MKPLVIDLYCGRFGWSRGFVAQGWRSVGFDLVHESHHGPVPDGCGLVLQDTRTLHGSQFKDAAAIVASPPCQRYSRMAMPFSRGKREAAAIRVDTTGAMLRDLNELFETCFRLQREASEAAGRRIPLVVENVKGAQPWVIIYLTDHAEQPQRNGRLRPFQTGAVASDGQASHVRAPDREGSGADPGEHLKRQKRGKRKPG